MKYSNGIEIRLGDCVKLYGVHTGIVVFSVDADEYSNEFPKNEWAYLKSGVMVRTDNGALIHFACSDVNDPNEIMQISPPNH
jgi:hypothetical protein